MILDAIPFRQILAGTDTKNRALVAFTDYLERKLGVKIVKDMRDVPFGRQDLDEPLRLGALLKEYGIIESFGPVKNFWPDEPQTKSWYAICKDPTSHRVGGTTWDNDESALRAALSEALERYIWMTQDDYFINPIKTTTEKISKTGRYVAPEKIVGFSQEQRTRHPQRRLRPEAEYTWVRGTSLVSGSRIYVPAQTVSGMRRFGKEPVIRQQNTNGLATWPTQSGARLNGALEVIEREAYMIMWLNQLTLPRIALAPLCAASPSLARAIALCEKYRFKTHVIQLATDAPAHAVAVVMEDISGNAPRFTVGLKAHTSLSHAVEKAITEALRSHHGYRAWVHKGNTWDVHTPLEKIGHHDRVYYWGVPEHAKHLEFMIRGPEIKVAPAPWDGDTIEEHLKRIVAWCKSKNFEFISVPLTASAKNPTSLHVEMVLMPELTPTYLNESVQQFGGTRLHDVPKALGYVPRKTLFAERPHPFL